MHNCRYIYACILLTNKKFNENLCNEDYWKNIIKVCHHLFTQINFNFLKYYLPWEIGIKHIMTYFCQKLPSNKDRHCVPKKGLTEYLIKWKNCALVSTSISELESFYPKPISLCVLTLGRRILFYVFKNMFEDPSKRNIWIRVSEMLFLFIYILYFPYNN